MLQSRPVYTERQSQRCDTSMMMLAILFSLKTMEPLQNGVATYFQVTLLFSMKTVSLASSQWCRRVEADTWCEQALKACLQLSVSNWSVRGNAYIMSDQLGLQPIFGATHVVIY